MSRYKFGGGGGLTQGDADARYAPLVWTEVGNFGTTEALSGVGRKQGTLDQSTCAFTLTLTDDQQYDLLTIQGSGGAKLATFVGVDTWVTSTGAAPSLATRAAGQADRFRFERTDGLVYGYWLTDPGPAGHVLADVAYDPGTLTDSSIASATWAALDGTNLAATFTAPASGAVDVLLEALCYNDNGTASQSWGVMQGASMIVASEARVFYPNGAQLLQLRMTHTFRITGLTPGTSYTWKWAFARDTGSGNCHTYYGGVLGGLAIMRVTSA